MSLKDVFKKLDEQEELYKGEVEVEKLSGNIVKKALNDGVTVGIRVARMIINEHMGEKTFTVAEIRKYIDSQDSRGDISYNLSDESIIKANELQEGEGCDCCDSYDNESGEDYCKFFEDYIPTQKLRTGCENKTMKE